MGIVVLGAVFVDIKGYPLAKYIPGGRNVGRVEQVAGGVSRNVVEDIANVELRPTFVSLVDDTGTGADVVEQLRRHKVNTDYVRAVPDGMGTWLAVFDNSGDVCASISKRPDLTPLKTLLDNQGDEIFSRAHSIAVEIDMDKEILKRVFFYAEKYDKPVFAVVSNMGIAVERRDLLQRTSWQHRHMPGPPGRGEGYHRRRGCIFRRRNHRPDLWKEDCRCLRHRRPAGRRYHLHP